MASLTLVIHDKYGSHLVSHCVSRVAQVPEPGQWGKCQDWYFVRIGKSNEFSSVKFWCRNHLQRLKSPDMRKPINIRLNICTKMRSIYRSDFHLSRNNLQSGKFQTIA